MSKLRDHIAKLPNLRIEEPTPGTVTGFIGAESFRRGHEEAQLRRRIAIEEASHAVAATVYGIPVLYATIDGDQPHMFRDAYFQTGDLALEALVVSLLAGSSAQKLFFGDVVEGSDSWDVEKSREYLGREYDDPLEIEFALRRYRDAADRLVKTERIRIRRLADALLEHGHLDAEQIAAL